MDYFTTNATSSAEHLSEIPWFKGIHLPHSDRGWGKLWRIFISVTQQIMFISYVIQLCFTTFTVGIEGWLCWCYHGKKENAGTKLTLAGEMKISPIRIISHCCHYTQILTYRVIMHVIILYNKLNMQIFQCVTHPSNELFMQWLTRVRSVPARFE